MVIVSLIWDDKHQKVGTAVNGVWGGGGQSTEDSRLAIHLHLKDWDAERGKSLLFIHSHTEQSSLPFYEGSTYYSLL